MPIGARHVDEGLLLVRRGETFATCLPSGAPTGAKVCSPLPCAALTHASCDMSKRATRDIAQWRHPSLPPLLVAISESADRVVLPPVAVTEPSSEWDWTHAQREAYDRGVEALRRQGHESARRFRITDELRSEAMRHEREHRRAEAEAKADETICLRKAQLASMTDWREVSSAVPRITPHLAKAVRACSALAPERPPMPTSKGTSSMTLPLTGNDGGLRSTPVPNKRRARELEMLAYFDAGLSDGPPKASTGHQSRQTPRFRLHQRRQLPHPRPVPLRLTRSTRQTTDPLPHQSGRAPVGCDC